MHLWGLCLVTRFRLYDIRAYKYTFCNSYASNIFEAYRYESYSQCWRPGVLWHELDWLMISQWSINGYSLPLSCKPGYIFEQIAQCRLTNDTRRLNFIWRCLSFIVFHIYFLQMCYTDMYIMIHPCRVTRNLLQDNKRNTQIMVLFHQIKHFKSKETTGF